MRYWHYPVCLFALLAVVTALVIAMLPTFSGYQIGTSVQGGGGDVEEIINGYDYENFGIGSNIYCSSPENAIYGKILVDSKVEDYKLVGTKIHVARRPLIVITYDGTGGASRLSGACEFYLVNTDQATVSQERPDDYVQCSAMNGKSE